MHNINLNIIFFVALFHLSQNVNGQYIFNSSVGAAGSSSVGSGIVLQQSIGQPSLITNEQSENGMGLRQGFIQPIWFEIESNELDVVLYPNPNKGDFSFKVNLSDNITYDYEILNVNGKLVLRAKGLGNELIKISITNPSSGMYHLKVISKEKTSAFKINIIN